MAWNSSKFNSDLKWLVSGFFKDGMIIEDGSILGYPPTKDQQRLCCKIAHLVLDPNGLCKADTKNYLLGAEVFKGNADNPNTSRSRIQYDMKKLRLLMGDQMLADICRKRDGFVQYEEQIDNILKKYQSRSIFDKLVLKVKHSDKAPAHVDLSADEKITLLELFETYGKNKVKRAEESVTLEMIRYVKYLEENQDRLSGEEQEFWELLVQGVQ